MKFEFSAGGIVFTKRKAKSEEQIAILLCQHSLHHGWGFPKGLIGDASAGSAQAKETKEEAALREVEEETGAKAEILEAIEPVSYWYVFEGEKIKKTVYYFIMKFTGGNITKHDFEMENVKWVPIEEVVEKLTFKSDKKTFEKASPIVRQLSST